jgi:hypothetical protein
MEINFNNLIDSITTKFKTISIEEQNQIKISNEKEYEYLLNDLIHIIELNDETENETGLNTEQIIDVKTLQNSILVLSSNLEQKLNEDTINLVYSRMTMTPNSLGYIEMTNYQKLIKFYENTKNYLMNLKDNKMIEHPALLHIIQHNCAEMPVEFNVFLNTFIAESTFNPSSEVYNDFSLYSKNLLVILDGLIKAYFQYSNVSSLLDCSFIKRFKILLMIYNITILLAYFVVKY